MDSFPKAKKKIQNAEYAEFRICLKNRLTKSSLQNIYLLGTFKA